MGARGSGKLLVLKFKLFVILMPVSEKYLVCLCSYIKIYICVLTHLLSFPLYACLFGLQIQTILTWESRHAKVWMV